MQGTNVDCCVFAKNIGAQASCHLLEIFKDNIEIPIEMFNVEIKNVEGSCVSAYLESIRVINFISQTRGKKIPP